MPRLVIDKRSIASTQKNFRVFITRMHQASLVAASKAGRALEADIKKTANAPALGGSPGTHADTLAFLDHPYASRHGSIQFTPSGGPDGLANTDLLVHNVTGGLWRAIGGRTTGGRNPAHTISVDENAAPYARHVIRGTEVMLGRDFLWGTATDNAVQARMWSAILSVFRPTFGRGF